MPNSGLSAASAPMRPAINTPAKIAQAPHAQAIGIGKRRSAAALERRTDSSEAKRTAELSALRRDAASGNGEGPDWRRGGVVPNAAVPGGGPAYRPDSRSYGT